MELIFSLLGLGAALFGWVNSGWNDEKEEIQNYESRKDDLTAYQEQFETLKLYTVPQLESDLNTTNQNIEAYSDYVDPETGLVDFTKTTESLALKQDVQSYDDYLNNWQLSYDKQVTAQETQGKSDLSQLMANWSDAEVLAADRGASGSMSLVARQQKQKAVDYAGSDLSLAGNDGLYGLTMNELRTTLATNKSQAEQERSISAQKYDESLTRQSQDYADLLTTKNNQTTALGQEKENLANAEQNVTDTSSWINQHQNRYNDLLKRHDA
ncbi:MAG: hypothetical protein ACQGQO_08745 [Sphaerochaetaceae bacterium]